jgi:phosphoserine phosphatase
MGEVGGILTGELLKVCLPADKAAFAADRCRLAGHPSSRLVALGDSSGDLPLFAAAGFSVAINGSQSAVAGSCASVVTRDLRDVVPIVLSHFSSLG